MVVEQLEQKEDLNGTRKCISKIKNRKKYLDRNLMGLGETE